jgi:short-subunit dehydrogenase
VQMAKQKLNLVLISRSHDKLENVAKEIGTFVYLITK